MIDPNQVRGLPDELEKLDRLNNTEIKATPHEKIDEIINEEET